MPAKAIKEETPTEEDAWGGPDWGQDVEKEQNVDYSSADANRDLLTISLKGGSGTQAWMVLHANGVDEAVRILEDPEWESLVELVARRGGELQEAHGGSSKPSGFAQKPSGGSGWGNKAKPAASPRSGGKGQVAWNSDERAYGCEHGEAKKRDGESDKGPWVGWFCPSSDRDEQCKPKFKN